MAFTTKSFFLCIACALILVSLAITSPKANAQVVIDGKTVNRVNVTGTTRCSPTVTGPCIPSVVTPCTVLSRVNVGVTFRGNQIASNVTNNDGNFGVIVHLPNTNISSNGDLLLLEARIHHPINNCSIYAASSGYLVGRTVPQFAGGLTGDVFKLNVPSMSPSS